MPPTPSIPVIKTVVFAALIAPSAATANAIADILSLSGTSQMKTASYSPKQYQPRGWYCFGEYDAVIICDVPDNESMSAIALAVAADGAIKAARTTVLMTGTEGVGGMKKADAVAKTYKPAR